jgi:hypothetical protein
MYENIEWRKFDGVLRPALPVRVIKEALTPDWRVSDCGTRGDCPDEIDCEGCIFDRGNRSALRKFLGEDEGTSGNALSFDSHTYLGVLAKYMHDPLDTLRGFDMVANPIRPSIVGSVFHETAGSRPSNRVIHWHEVFKTKGDDDMNKNIVRAFPKTEDAVLVQKHLGHEINETFVVGLLVKANAGEILVEAKRREEAQK